MFLSPVVERSAFTTGRVWGDDIQGMSLAVFLIPYAIIVLFLMGYIYFGLRMARQQGTFTRLANIVAWIFSFLFIMIAAFTIIFIFNYDLAQRFISF